jgi:hypothetical protein
MAKEGSSPERIETYLEVSSKRQQVNNRLTISQYKIRTFDLQLLAERHGRHRQVDDTSDGYAAIR